MKEIWPLILGSFLTKIHAQIQHNLIKSNKISTLSLRRMCAGVEKFPNILEFSEKEHSPSLLQHNFSVEVSVSRAPSTDGKQQSCTIQIHPRWPGIAKEDIKGDFSEWFCQKVEPASGNRIALFHQLMNSENKQTSTFFFFILAPHML